MLTMQKKLSKSFYMLLSLPATAMGFALSVQISALSWILTTQYHLDIHQVGLVWAAGPIAGILGQVIIGMISDKVWFLNGRRRPFILIGGVLAALMLLALPNIGVISDQLGIEGLMGVAIAIALTLDLSINISFNPTRTIIADVTPPGDKRTQGYTWMQTVSGTFGVLAYAIGAYFGNINLIYFAVLLVFVLSVFPPLLIKEPKVLGQYGVEDHDANQAAPAVNAVGGLQIMMLLQPLWGFILYDIYAMTIQLAGINTDHYWAEIIALLITAILVVKTITTSEVGLAKTQAGLVGFKKILAAHSFSWIGIQTMFVFMFAYLQDKMPHLSNDELGKVISIAFLVLSAVSAILPALVLEPLAAKIGRVKTHTLCIASMAISYGAISVLGDTTTLLYPLMALLGIGWAAVISLPFAIMSEKVEQTQMGLFMGLFNLSVVLPQLLVSLGIGLFISKSPDKSLVFQISTVALAVSAIAWFMVREKAPAADSQANPGAGHAIIE